MKEINAENVKVLNKKVGELSVDLARGKIKNGDELAQAILERLNQEEILIASTLLIIERYNIIKQKLIGMRKMDRENSGVMFG